MLRKRIQELQHYRRMGLSTPADIDKYEADVIKRVSRKPLSLHCADLTQAPGERESYRWPGLLRCREAQPADTWRQAIVGSRFKT